MNASACGVYVLGNDYVIDDAIAFMNSLRLHDPDLPAMLIPYDANHLQLSRILERKYGVGTLERQDLYSSFEESAGRILGWRAPGSRKLACWFGPFDKFIYFDVDIVVFQSQQDIFSLLESNDFLYYNSGRTDGIEFTFSEQVFTRTPYSQQDIINAVFNTGFFASRRGVFTYEQLMALLEEAVALSDIFLPYYQEQSLLPYLLLKAVAKRVDLREFAPAVPTDAWAGNPLIKACDDKVYRPDGMAARHLHWGSLKKMPDRPYIDLWLRYRYPGIRGVPQRLIVGAFRRGERIIRRALCTYMDGWYKPSFQLRRAQRILIQRVAHPLERFLLSSRR